MLSRRCSEAARISVEDTGGAAQSISNCDKLAKRPLFILVMIEQGQA
jgi:hypothetical protein